MHVGKERKGPLKGHLTAAGLKNNCFYSDYLKLEIEKLILIK